MSARTALLTLLLVADASVAANLPNIVLIVSDNQSQTLLGAYGNTEILTPYVDRLVAEGEKFKWTFSVSKVCSPTRATLLTGLLPSQTGIHVALPTHVDVDHWSAIEEFRNLPQTLKDSGGAEQVFDHPADDKIGIDTAHVEVEGAGATRSAVLCPLPCSWSHR